MEDVTYLYRTIRRFYTLIEFLALGACMVLGGSVGWLSSHGPLWMVIAGCGVGILLGVVLASYTATKLDDWFETVDQRAEVTPKLPAAG